MSATRILERLLRSVCPDRESFEGILGDLQEERLRRGAQGRRADLLHQLRLASIILHQAVFRLRTAARPGPEAGTRAAIAAGVLRFEVRCAVRRLGKSPAFTVAAVLTLALGVGVNTAVFGVVESVLLRPLPFQDPGELVQLEYHGSRMRIPFTPSEFERLDGRLRGAASVGAFRWQNEAVLSSGADSWLLSSAGVSGNLFELLGATAILGRTIIAADAAPGAAPVVVISHRTWEAVFGRDPGVVGRRFGLDDGRYARGSYEVIGVMPPTFWFPDRAIDLWVPIPVDPSDVSTFDARSENVQILARVRGEATPVAVAGDVEALLGFDSPGEGRSDGRRIVARPFRDTLVGDQARPLGILSGVALLVLLIAAVNLAGLMLAREQRQRPALRVRTALGASRSRLVTARVLDGALLAVLGAVAGVAMAGAALPLLVSRLPAEVSRIGEASLDLRVLSVGLAAAACGVLVAVVTPLTSAGISPRHGPAGPNGPGGARDGGSGRVRRLLVVTQIGLSIPLTAASAVLLHSLWRLQRVSPGIDVERVVTLRIDARHASMGALDDYFESVLQLVRGSPGVRGASIVRDLSFTGASRTNVSWPGLYPRGEDVLVDYQVIHSGFFGTLGIPMLGGRDFSPADGADAPRVAIVNQRFVDVHFEGRSPVGLTLALAGEPTRIVGVASDVRRRGLREPPQPELYVPYAQIFNARGTRLLLVRIDGESASPLNAITTGMRGLDPDVAIGEARPLSEILDASLAGERGLADLLSLFACLSLTLSVAGLAGLLAFMVGSRESELAVRTALGATPSSLSRLVMRETVVLCSVGLLLGIPSALGLIGLLRSYLFEVSTLDPVAFAGVAAALCCAAAAATWVPARRAMGTDPAAAMRGRGER